jgi:hypothetical protein
MSGSARCRLLEVWVLAGLAWGGGALQASEPIVPGTGDKAENVGDDFEDPKWSYIPGLPKSSKNIDGQTRLPAGRSTNNRWFESTYRGTPDILKRVETPEGGLPGSEGAMMMRTLYSGIPNQIDGENQQDDLIANTSTGIGGFVPVSWRPSVVVRVYLPPFDEWEKRTGTSFALRADCRGRKKGEDKLEAYWPGIFIQFIYNEPRKQPNAALLVIRGLDSGHDFSGPLIKEPGWWTLGMSFSPDGYVHYYAHAGVENLRAQDRIASHYPYYFRCERFQNFFFNVANANNGRSWSTSWIVDDPAVYFASRPRASVRAANRPR